MVDRRFPAANDDEEGEDDDVEPGGARRSAATVMGAEVAAMAAGTTAGGSRRVLGRVLARRVCFVGWAPVDVRCLGVGAEHGEVLREGVIVVVRDVSVVARVLSETRRFGLGMRVEPRVGGRRRGRLRAGESDRQRRPSLGELDAADLVRRARGGKGDVRAVVRAAVASLTAGLGHREHGQDRRRARADRLGDDVPGCANAGKRHLHLEPSRAGRVVVVLGPARGNRR